MEEMSFGPNQKTVFPLMSSRKFQSVQTPGRRNLGYGVRKESGVSVVVPETPRGEEDTSYVLEGGTKDVTRSHKQERKESSLNVENRS